MLQTGPFHPQSPLSRCPKGLQVGPLPKSKVGTFSSGQTGKQWPPPWTWGNMPGSLPAALPARQAPTEVQVSEESSLGCCCTWRAALVLLNCIIAREEFRAIREHSGFSICQLNGSQGKRYPAPFCSNKNRILSNTTLHSKAYHPNSADQDIQAYCHIKTLTAFFSFILKVWNV